MVAAKAEQRPHAGGVCRRIGNDFMIAGGFTDRHVTKVLELQFVADLEPALGGGTAELLVPPLGAPALPRTRGGKKN
jgi:hypothetical protein